MKKIVARPLVDYRTVTGLIALVVAVVEVTRFSILSSRMHLATGILALGAIMLIVDSLGRAVTFDNEAIRFRAITRRWQSWPLDGSTELRYAHQKIGSRWGLSKPEYLILVRRSDREALALVDGLMTKQSEWCDFLKEQVASGRLLARPEAISMLERLSTTHPAGSTRP
jgi:hypothetical protein